VGIERANEEVVSQTGGFYRFSVDFFCEWHPADLLFAPKSKKRDVRGIIQTYRGELAPYVGLLHRDNEYVMRYKNSNS